MPAAIVVGTRNRKKLEEILEILGDLGVEFTDLTRWPDVPEVIENGDTFEANAQLKAAYYSTKFAVEGLTEALAFELKAHGIRVKLIEPAHFKTEFIARSLQSVAHEAYDTQADNMRLWMVDMDRKAPDPAPIIDAIYRAATDGSNRLRYPVRGRIALALHAVMPRSWWNAMMAGGLNRRPKAA